MIFRKKKKNKGSLPVIILAVLMILAIVSFSTHHYFRENRNMVWRLQCGSVAESMARAAAKEAGVYVKAGVMNSASMSEDDILYDFLLKPLVEKDENQLHEDVFDYPCEKLITYKLANEIGCKVYSVKMQYKNFRKIFGVSNKTANLLTECNVADDPFERQGAVEIISSADFKGITKSYTLRYEMRIVNTLMPVVSKFTFFSKNKTGDPNQLIMSPSPSVCSPIDEIANQGFINANLSKLRAPLVLIHNPGDVKEISGYCNNHSALRQFLPPDDSKVKITNKQRKHKISMIDRGWVYLGLNNYNLNITPGLANPMPGVKCPKELIHQRYGNAFMIIESGLVATLKKLKQSKFPYDASFLKTKPPLDESGSPAPEFSDYILNIDYKGIFWKTVQMATNGTLRNYFEDPDNANVSLTEGSSLLQLCGDVQALAVSPAVNYIIKPSSYLDRRSPTLILGKVYRLYAKRGTITQNCTHGVSSPYYDIHAKTKSPYVHKYPYGAYPGHFYPLENELPYFKINFDTGVIMNSGYAQTKLCGSGPLPPVGSADYFSSLWRIVADDTVATDETVFARARYDINDVFNLVGSNACMDTIKTYSLFMSRIVAESYNKSYNWIVANSKPEGGVFEPDVNIFGLKQKDVKIITPATGNEDDELFFYGKNNTKGACQSGRVKIMQYEKAGGNFNLCYKMFEAAVLFEGVLGAIKLFGEDYINPVTSEQPVAVNKYDIRYRAGFVYENYESFCAQALADAGDTSKAPQPGKRVVFKQGGVYYIDNIKKVNLDEYAEVTFTHNTILIVKGDIAVPPLRKTAVAVKSGSTLTILSIEGDIILSGPEPHIYEASLNALGEKSTIKKSDNVSYFQVFGNMTMDSVYFDLKPGSLFKVKSLPGGTTLLVPEKQKSFIRMSVTYDPALDVCDYKNYIKHYNYSISNSFSYWSK